MANEEITKRYWNANDEIDWKWLNRAACGVAGKLSDDERLVAQAFYLSGKLGVLRWLVRHGEIDPDDVQIDENAQAAAQQFSAYLADRHRKHSLWARGRKTMSY